MKSLKIPILLVIVSLASCKMDPSHTQYTNAGVYISDRIIPETGVVNQPIQITARAKEFSDCWSGLRVNLYETSAMNLTLTGTGNYNSYGYCNEEEVTEDSTITFIPKVAGKFVITTWITPVAYERDTIVVSAPQP